MNSNLVMNTSQCPMCEELQMKEHILKKWDNFATIFNRYPYSIGDIMVIPLQPHIDSSRCPVADAGCDASGHRAGDRCLDPCNR